MRFSFQLQNTDEFEATATVTMKVREWKALYQQMQEAHLDLKWPSADLANAAYAVFTATTGKIEKEIVVQ